MYYFETWYTVLKGFKTRFALGGPMLKCKLLVLCTAVLLVSCSRGGGGGSSDNGNSPQSNEGKVPGTSPNGEKPAPLSEQDKSRFISEFKKLDSFQKALDYAFDPNSSPNLDDSYTKEIYNLLKRGQCSVEKKNLSLSFEEGEHLVDESGYFRLSGAKCPVVVNDSNAIKGKSIVNISNQENILISSNLLYQGKNYRKNLDADVIAATGIIEIATDLTGTNITNANSSSMTVSSIADGNQKMLYVGGRIYNALIKVVQSETSARTAQSQTRTKELYLNYHVKARQPLN